MRKSRNKIGGNPKALGAAVAAVAVAAALSSPAVPAFAANTYTLSTSQVAVSGGTVVYLIGDATVFTTPGGSTNVLGFRMMTPTTATCPANYAAAAAAGSTVVNGGLATVSSATAAYLTTPAGLTAGSAYKVCLYESDSESAVASLNADNELYSTDSSSSTLTAVNTADLSPSVGKATDKVNLTASTGIFSASSYSTQFVSGVTACPTTYSTVSSTAVVGTTAKTSATVLSITVPTLTTNTAYYVCVYAGTTVGTSALSARGNVTFASHTATLPSLTVSPSGGSSGTTTTVTVSAPSAIFTGTPDTLLTRNTCPATYAAGTAPLEPYDAGTTKISTSKLAVTMPDTVIVGGLDVMTPWKVCVYASSSGALVASPGTYTVAPVLTASNADTLIAVGSGSAAATGSGPAQGGSTVTISGLTGIPTAAGATLTASLGGSPIQNITAIDSTSFSGTTTSHAAGAVNLSVTTAAGTKSTTDTPYTYTYGITVSPNTAASGGTTVLDIQGAGFSSLTFGSVTATALSAGAYVLLTNNEWNGRDFSAGVTAIPTTLSPVSWCNNVLAISDTEIICTLTLNDSFGTITTANTAVLGGGNVDVGTYTVTVVNAITALDSDLYNYSIVSSGSTFTVANY